MTDDRDAVRRANATREQGKGPEKVAGAVARRLRLEGVDTSLVEVGSAPAELPEGLDLLVVGVPTHAFSLSRPTTRGDAVRQCAPSERTTRGLREWLGEWLGAVQYDAARLPALAVFDTRVTKVRWLPKAAGPTAARLGHKSGLATLEKPVAFLVDDHRGPLIDGELERAEAWGRRLGATCVDRRAARGGFSVREG